MYFLQYSQHFIDTNFFNWNQVQIWSSLKDKLLKINEKNVMQKNPLAFSPLEPETPN